MSHETTEEISPGPWKIATKISNYQFSGEEAAKLRTAGLPTRFEALSIGANDGRGPQVAIIPLDESSRANAKLIEAAPKLLKICKSVMNYDLPSKLKFYLSNVIEEATG